MEAQAQHTTASWEGFSQISDSRLFKTLKKRCEGRGKSAGNQEGAGISDEEGQSHRGRRFLEGGRVLRPTCQEDNICFLQGSTAVLPDVEGVVAAQQPPCHPP